MTKYTFTEKKDTRSGFGAGLHELGKANPNVVALCADLTGSLKMDAFKKDFPERFFQVGIAEANMMGLAAGMTIGGKIPINPSGGLESKGHPIGATGLGQIHELVTQLRGEAGKRQVEKARIAIQENGGGLHGIEEAVVAVNIFAKQ